MAKFEKSSVEVLNLIAQGYSNKDAAVKAGITEHTLYDWLNTKPQFFQSFKEAQKQGDLVRINSVEAALLDVARGFEYEEVKTEYESVLNQNTGKYEPTIKKQVRTKKRVVPQTEAIKFYLSNKAPEEWKNRQQQELVNLDALKDLQVRRVGKDDDASLVVCSEDEIID